MISILHLSDIHFNKVVNPIEHKLQKLYEAIRNELANKKVLFIVITGDISQSGQKKEFDKAKTFLDALEELLKNKYKTLEIEYVFSQGNHDCDLTLHSKMRDMLIEGVKSDNSSMDDEIAKTCVKVQQDYLSFVESFNVSSSLKQSLSNDLFSCYNFNIYGKSIAFNSYNLAWCFTEKTNQADIVFPLEYLNVNGIIKQKNHLTISLQHYPFHWVKYNNLRKYKEFIENTSDIILTGHEHQESVILTNNFINDTQLEHIEAMALQNANNSAISGFNLIVFDLDNDDFRHNVHSYTWENDIYKSITRKDLPLKIDNKIPFTFKEKYSDKLNSLDLSIQHKRVDKAYLDNLFVFPDVNLINSEEDNEDYRSTEFTSEEFIKKDVPGLKIFYGEDNTGKTTLAKVFQSAFKNKSFLPILLNGANFKQHDYHENSLKTLILKKFKSQYEHSADTINKLEQFDNCKKVIIIDDLQSITLNHNYKSKMIASLLSLGYTNIVIFASETLSLEGLYEGELAEALREFSHYNINSFGHILRDKLIDKWITLGRDSEISLPELREERRKKAQQITTTVGLNFVQSRPIYILTLLQAMDAQESSLENTSYAHYYHYLILTYLNKDRQKAWETPQINTIFSFVSNLAFLMFKKRNTNITKRELQEYSHKYIKDVDFEPTFDILEVITKAEILLTDDEEIFYFSQKYLYYYFVGKYFSQHSDEDETMNYIKKMSQSLYKIEFGNILMFTLHFSAKKKTIHLLINEAKKLFPEIQEFKFSKDEIEKLNSSIKEDSIKISERSPDESRRKELILNEENDTARRKLQKYDDNIKETNPDEYFDKDVENLNFYETINQANKLIEILGEIVKNYSGDSNALNATLKREIIDNAYGLSLRMLKTIIEMFEEHHEFLIKQICKLIYKIDVKTDMNKEKEINKFVFRMASSIAHGNIKKLANALGIVELKHIYQRISDKDKSNLAYQLISKAIELDFKQGLSNPEGLFDLHMRLKVDSNILTDSILKKFVRDHMYIFELPHNKRASVCKKMDIGIEGVKQVLISQKRKI